MIGYYDKDGKEIDMLDWGNKMKQKDYKRVGLTHVGEKITVSTVWCGLYYLWTGGEKLIFETMVFIDGEDGEMERYSTLEQARRGHDKMVKKYQNPELIKGGIVK